MDVAQDYADSARRLSVAHAHAGAIDLVTGRPKEATEHFELQRFKAQKASRLLGSTQERTGRVWEDKTNGRTIKLRLDALA